MRLPIIQQGSNQFSRYEGHITGEEHLRFGSAGFESSVNSAQRTTTREPIAPNNSHRQPQFTRFRPDVAEQRARAQAQAGFLPAHPLAQAARQDTDAAVYRRRMGTRAVRP